MGSTHCLSNLARFRLLDGAIVSYHYALARFILPKESSSLFLQTWSLPFICIVHALLLTITEEGQ